jgi:hypothetical protein
MDAAIWRSVSQQDRDIPSSEAQRAVGYLGRTNRWTYKCCHSTTALQLGGRGSVTTHSAVNEVHMISVRR